MPPPSAALSTPSAKRRSSVRARPGHAEDDVGLLGLAADQLDAGRAVRIARRPSRGAIGRGVACLAGRRPSRRPRGPGDDLVVVDVARGGDDQVRRVVVLLVEAAMRSAVQGVDGVDRAEDRAAERGVAEHGVREQVVHAVARVVLVHGDLFEDHAALGVDVRRADQRAGQHVADDVDGERQVGVEHPRVVAGVLLGGEGVHLAADRVDGGGDVQRAALRGALEEQVLEVVRGAVQRRASRRGSRRAPRCRRSPSGRTAGSR